MLYKFHLWDITQPLQKGSVTLSRVMQPARFELSYFLVPSPALSALRERSRRGWGCLSQGQVFLGWSDFFFFFIPGKHTECVIHHFLSYFIFLLGLSGGEIHYNQRSGSLSSRGIIIKTPKRVQCRISSKLWFSISYLLCLEEPFANLAVGKGSRGSRMNACPVAFPLSQACVQSSSGAE